MFTSILPFWGTLVRLFCSCRSLLLEKLVLQQQLAVFKRRHPRPKLDAFDKLFWALPGEFGPGGRIR
jgi:hypothetical protein